MKKLYTFSLFLLLNAPFFAQKANIFDVFYDENRIHTYEIQQDTIWVGSFGGLVKRLLPDGTVLDVLNSNNSPLNKPVAAIAIAKNGKQMAFAHRVLGLTLKSGNEWKSWAAADIIETTGTILPSILSVGFDKEARLWVYGSDRKLHYFNGGQWSINETLGSSQYISKFLNDPSGNLFWISDQKITGLVDDKLVSYQGQGFERFHYAAFDPNGHLFALTDKGYILKFSSPNHYSQIPLPTLGLPPMVESYRIQFAMNRIGDITVLTDKKIYRRKMTGETETKSLPASWFGNSVILPNLIAADTYGNIWYSSNSLRILQKITKEIELVDAPLSGFIKGTSLVMESQSPYFWSSNYGYSYRQHLSDRSKNESFFQNRQYFSYFAPTGQANQMWIASIDGLQLYDNGQFTKIAEAVANEDKRMFSILTLKDGKVMGIGQRNKKLVIKIYDPRAVSWTYFEFGKEGMPDYFDLKHCKDPKGDAWFIYTNGFLNYQNNAWDSIRLEDTGINFKAPRTLSITPDGHIWTTRFDTLYRYNQREWTINHILECPSIAPFSSTGVQHLFTDSKGRLWASGGCNEARMSMFDGEQWYHLDTTNSNLPKDFLLGKIAEDINGDLWIESSPVVRLRTKDFEYWRQKQYDESLHIWPNPATTGFTIRIPPTASRHIELMDVQGRILQRKKVLNNGEDVFFERGSLPNGLYFVRLQSLTGRVWVQKVILH